MARIIVLPDDEYARILRSAVGQTAIVLMPQSFAAETGFAHDQDVEYSCDATGGLVDMVDHFNDFFFGCVDPPKGRRTKFLKAE